MSLREGTYEYTLFEEAFLEIQSRLGEKKSQTGRKKLASALSGKGYQAKGE